MKKWALILLMFLCLVAVGGLAVIFRAEDTTPSDDNHSTDGSSYEVEDIDLDKTNLIF